MTPSSFLRLVRHPAAIALRLLVWPAAIVLLSNGAGATEDDGLAAGLLTFAVIGVTGFLFALADGLVLRFRWLVLVWSVTTLALAAVLSLQPVIDFVLTGRPGRRPGRRPSASRSTTSRPTSPSSSSSQACRWSSAPSPATRSSGRPVLVVHGRPSRPA